jgi:hypothetical protein
MIKYDPKGGPRSCPLPCEDSTLGREIEASY